MLRTVTVQVPKNLQRRLRAPILKLRRRLTVAIQYSFTNQIRTITTAACSPWRTNLIPTTRIGSWMDNV